MLHYARQDTHYLLYIYDRMRNELHNSGNESNNLLLAALNRSRTLCKKVYEKKIFDQAAIQMSYNKADRPLNKQQVSYISLNCSFVLI